MFKHNDNVIDPRDKHLVTYSKSSKRFIVEDSDLRANGIEPMDHTYTIGGRTKVIFLWSEKHQIHITYRLKKVIKNAGDIIAWVYQPYFGMITDSKELFADRDSKGTELHILND